MPRPHWLLGQETHVGRGYAVCSRHPTKRDALEEARTYLELEEGELAALSRDRRVEFPLARAKELQFIALELVRCDCGDPEMHDD